MVRTAVDDRGADIVERRQIDEIGAVGVDADEMEVFVTLEILEVDDAA
jgi:hypothetical protein